MSEGERHWLHALAWSGAVLLVLWWTLLPFTQDLSGQALQRAFADIQWILFVERGRPALWSDVLGNLALFTPFGVAGWRCLEGRKSRLLLLLASAAVLSLGVEALQLTIPARRTSATDLATDVLGAGVGAGLGRIWEVRGRAAARSWLRRLVRGEPVSLLSVLFAACVLFWAALPGHGGPAGVWHQTQSFASSFRRFPGWGTWAQQSVHPFLMGSLAACLATRSSGGGRATAFGFGLLFSSLLAVGAETAQLAGLGRRPEIFEALALAAGGLPGAAVGICANVVGVRAWACLVLGLGLALVPAGDNPRGETWAVLLIGALFLALSTGGRGMEFARSPRSREELRCRNGSWSR